MYNRSPTGLGYNFNLLRSTSSVGTSSVGPQEMYTKSGKWLWLPQGNQGISTWSVSSMLKPVSKGMYSFSKRASFTPYPKTSCKISAWNNDVSHDAVRGRT